MNAKYTRWLKIELWTLFEAASVGVGLEPSRDAYDYYIGTDVLFDEIGNSRKREECRDLFDALKNACDKGTIRFHESRDSTFRNRRVDPGHFVAWALKRGFTLPKQIVALADSPESSEQRQPEQPFNGNTYSTKLLKAAYAVIEEFWKDWKPDMPIASQPTVIEWLKGKYSRESGDMITATEAKTIDRVVRPDRVREARRNAPPKPKGRR